MAKVLYPGTSLLDSEDKYISKISKDIEQLKKINFDNVIDSSVIANFSKVIDEFQSSTTSIIDDLGTINNNYNNLDSKISSNAKAISELDIAKRTGIR